MLEFQISEQAISNQKMAETLIMPIYKTLDKLDFVFIAPVVKYYEVCPDKMVIIIIRFEY